MKQAQHRWLKIQQLIIRIYNLVSRKIRKICEGLQRMTLEDGYGGLAVVYLPLTSAEEAYKQTLVHIAQLIGKGYHVTVIEEQPQKQCECICPWKTLYEEQLESQKGLKPLIVDA